MERGGENEGKEREREQVREWESALHMVLTIDIRSYTN